MVFMASILYIQLQCLHEFPARVVIRRNFRTTFVLFVNLSIEVVRGLGTLILCVMQV